MGNVCFGSSHRISYPSPTPSETSTSGAPERSFATPATAELNGLRSARSNRDQSAEANRPPRRAATPGTSGGISRQGEYSQRSALERIGISRDHPVWQSGMCTGIAMEWLADHINRGGASQGRMARLNSDQCTQNAIETNAIGQRERLVASVLSGGSLVEAERASMQAMLGPKNIALVGASSHFHLSERGSSKALVEAISASGYSVINLYDMKIKKNPLENCGHMLAVFSDGHRIQIFDGNYGEYHANVADAESLFKQLLSKYTGDLIVDKILVQRFSSRDD